MKFEFKISDDEIVCIAIVVLTVAAVAVVVWLL